MRILETERLTLWPIEEEDIEFLVELHADPEVARYLSLGRPRTEEETRTWLDKMLAMERENAISHLTILSRETGARLGRSGLLLFQIEEPSGKTDEHPLAAFFEPETVPPGLRTTDELEVGYALARSAWGQGFATEAATKLRDYAFSELDAPRVMSVIHPENLASVRVARKNGMVRFDTLDFFGKRFDRWLVEREEWERLPR